MEILSQKSIYPVPEATTRHGAVSRTGLDARFGVLSREMSHPFRENRSCKPFRHTFAPPSNKYQASSSRSTLQVLLHSLTAKKLTDGGVIRWRETFGFIRVEQLADAVLTNCAQSSRSRGFPLREKFQIAAFKLYLKFNYRRRTRPRAVSSCK